MYHITYYLSIHILYKMDTGKSEKSASTVSVNPSHVQSENDSDGSPSTDAIVLPPITSASILISSIRGALKESPATIALKNAKNVLALAQRSVKSSWKKDEDVTSISNEIDKHVYHNTDVHVGGGGTVNGGAGMVQSGLHTHDQTITGSKGGGIASYKRKRG